jgi:hypothetical protein
MSTTISSWELVLRRLIVIWAFGEKLRMNSLFNPIREPERLKKRVFSKTRSR